MANYSIELEGIDDVISNLQELSKSISSQDFMEFIGNKSHEIVRSKTNQSGISYRETEGYSSNNKKVVSKKEVTLYNDTMADLSNLSETTKINYPNGFSIAKAVEYGTGVVGASSEGSTQAQDWEYDVNNHGEKGWYYEKDGRIYWTKGMEGKLIYYKSSEEIKKQLPTMVGEFIQKTIK